MQEHIERFGCFIQPVLGSRWVPPYAYTVGLHQRGHPELVIVGAPLLDGACFLHLAASAFGGPDELEEGRHAVHNRLGVPACLLPVDRGLWSTPESPFAGIGHYHEGIEVELSDDAVRQVVWGDECGRMPGNQGLPPSDFADQPVFAAGDELRRKLPVAEDPDHSEECPACALETKAAQRRADKAPRVRPLRNLAGGHKPSRRS